MSCSRGNNLLQQLQGSKHSKHQPSMYLFSAAHSGISPPQSLHLQPILRPPLRNIRSRAILECCYDYFPLASLKARTQECFLLEPSRRYGAGHRVLYVRRLVRLFISGLTKQNRVLCSGILASIIPPISTTIAQIEMGIRPTS